MPKVEKRTEGEVSQSVELNFSREKAFECLFEFVRPIRFFSCGTWWGGGTCFLVCLKGKYYAITARHVLDRQGVEYNEARIMLSGCSFQIPILGHFFPQSSVLERYHLDVLVYRLDLFHYKLMTGRGVAVLNLEEQFHPADRVKGGSACVVGYPVTDDRYDYEKEIINDHISLRYGKVSDSVMEPPIYCVESSRPTYPTNGISGGPVLIAHDGVVKLIGVIVRASDSSGAVHFLDATVLLAAIFNFEGY